MSQLIELSARNFLGIKAVRLIPGDGVTEIVGEEGSGKTSVLRSIWTALGGAGNLPDAPIRDGESEADIYLDLGDIRVTWRMERGKEPKLLVTNRDGDVKKKPQSVLDALRGHLSFDPLTFDRLDDGTAKGRRAQAELLRKLAQLDTSDLDAEIARLSAEYTPVNTSAERMEAVAASVRVPEAPAEIGEERPVVDAVDVVAIAAKKGDVEKVRAENAQKRAEAERLRANANLAWGDAHALLEQIAELQRQHKAAESRAEAITAERNKAAAAIVGLVDPDTSAIDAEIAAARATNAAHRASIEAHNAHVRAARQAQQEHVRAAEERVRRTLEAAAERAKADDIKRRKAAALAERTARIAAARFPVEGLAVEGDVVTWKGRPYSQVNTSQRIPLCCSIGAALNPGLKFITIEHGNDIGRKVMPQIDAWAREHGYRILVERLEGTGASCVVIEDGGVRSVTQAPTEQTDTDW